MCDYGVVGDRRPLRIVDVDVQASYDAHRVSSFNAIPYAGAKSWGKSKQHLEHAGVLIPVKSVPRDL